MQASKKRRFFFIAGKTYYLIVLFVIMISFTITYRISLLVTRQKFSERFNAKDETPGLISDRALLNVRIPDCEYLVQNMTKGKWIRKVDLIENTTTRLKLLQEEERMWETLNTFWNKRGIQKGLWRPDGKCGYDIPQKKPPKSLMPLVGSWCNKDGPRPCCSDIHSGMCSPVSEEECKCPNCFDMRTKVLADVSEWITEDSSCTWRYYHGDEICDLISTSAYNDITFIGESVTRNMYGALLNLITEDFLHGSLVNDLTPKDYKVCVGPERYYWKQCRIPPADISKLYKGLIMCKKYKTIPFQLSYITMSKNSNFINGVKNKLGREGSLILFGMGIKIFCDPKTLINYYLKPAVSLLKKFYQNKMYSTKRWPKIIILATPAAGLLKPQRFLERQGTEKCRVFNNEVKNFCDKNDLIFLDTMPFSYEAFSFDGTHHALAVNAMKVQLFLNYLSQNIS